MKAIILASGEGSRLRPLTDTTPKPLIKILWKPLIEYNFEILKDIVDECIIVVKYKHEMFREYFWDFYGSMKLKYHIQSERPGTWAAISDITDIKSDDHIIILYGDSIYPAAALTQLIKNKKYGCLVKEVENPEIYGIFKEKDNKAVDIIEKPQEYIWNLANMWGFMVNGELLKMCKKIEISERWEYEITDGIKMFLWKYDFMLQRLDENILDIWYAWNLLDANEHYLHSLTTSHIEGTIEENVSIHGNIIVEEWAVVKSGSYIEGNCYFWKWSVVWPNAYIRGNTSVWENSKIGFSVEVKNSYIWDNSKIPHISYIWDSVVWNNVNLWCWFKVANLRHDGKNHRVLVKWKLVDTGKRKFWCIIADGVKTAINTQVYPGRVLETNSTTLPWEIIQ